AAFPRLRRTQGLPNLRKARDEDANRLGRERDRAFEELAAAHLGHHLIRDDDRIRGLAEERERLGGAARPADLEIVVKHASEKIQIFALIVDDQHAIATASY